MSCNGCRILRKGCSEDCMLRHCLQMIDNPQAQANATVFVAKFFGRACLMSFISSVPYTQRPSLFQSLLYEAVGRTVNPVSGAVGLLWTGNWHKCQTAVMTVLRGGAIESLKEYQDSGPEFHNISECASFRPRDDVDSGESKKIIPTLKRKICDYDDEIRYGQVTNLDLCLMHPTEEEEEKRRRRPATPSEESETTTLGSCSRNNDSSLLQGGEKKLLTLFL
ncbi:LOB domain-containing protein 39-like [Mercurialis annua]|uniref:LOB domain-containing protein 39-like n=1 Tax=Mercurialis annua TaxID=3986 RepID=UPI00215DEC52|nr:LOB domain-containing protein 39-like [Mercurialis annua]